VNIALAPVLILVGGPASLASPVPRWRSFVAVAGGVVALAVYVWRVEGYLRVDLWRCKPQLALWGRMLRSGCRRAPVLVSWACT